MVDQKDNNESKAKRDAANIRLAVGLGLMSFMIYVGFIFLQYMKSKGM